MKKILYTAALTMFMMPLAAQETYENAKLATTDLNGTARFVAMGGALDALGADISTISSNPAGIGLFRKSNVSVSFGLNTQHDISNAVGGNKTNASFDQVGVVFATRTSATSYINFAFNFHKSRNFDQILSASNSLNNASLNKLTYAKAKITAQSLASGGGGLLYEQRKDAPIVNKVDNNDVINYVPDFSRPYVTCNQLDDLFARHLNWEEDNKKWFYDPASGYEFDRSHTGYIGEYDLNISGNINNRVYLGLTVGIHDVHYKHYSEYVEHNYHHETGVMQTYDTTVGDSREITGTGYDVKFGAIFRPVAESPFRIGLSVATPTFYELRTSNYSFISDGLNRYSSMDIYDSGYRTSYKFKLSTPWKFGLSLGHTIGTQVALGLGYEYADYSAMDTRYITGSSYDYWTDTYTSNSSSDRVMNDHTSKTLKGVHTLRVGAEYKPDKDVAVRIGYNFVSPMYTNDGFKDGSLNSEASYISSSTDYTNWEATHRITCGFGWFIDQFNISAAYQYSITNGTFSPFMSYFDDYGQSSDDNKATHTDVSHKRSQFIITLGYTF